MTNQLEAAIRAAYEKGRNEWAPAGILVDAERTERDWQQAKAELAAEAQIGTKRLPQVGEVWRARTGELIAIISQASVLDGGFNTVTLTKGETAVNPGRVGLHDLDGKVYGGSSGATRPHDLMAFVTRFDS